MTEQQVLEWLYLDLEEIIDFDDKEDKRWQEHQVKIL